MLDLRARMRALHERFGTAAPVVAVIALIAVLAGTVRIAGSLAGKEEREVADQAGSAWTAAGTLSPGATLTGAWSISDASDLWSGFGPGKEFFVEPISFVIPLAGDLTKDRVHLIEGLAPASGPCSDGVAPGAEVANPEADPGNLCIFTNEPLPDGPTPPLIAMLGPSEPGASTSGANLVVLNTGNKFFTSGSYAVTGFAPQ